MMQQVAVRPPPTSAPGREGPWWHLARTCRPADGFFRQTAINLLGEDQGGVAENNKWPTPVALGGPIGDKAHSWPNYQPK